MPEASLFLAGDICPVGRMAAPFADGDAEAVFSDVLPLIRGCDAAVANLECPLPGPADRPILKAGPNLKAPRAAAGTLRKAGFTALGLANNHTLDYGASGLGATRAACGEAGLPTFGAGADLAEARRPLILDLNGVRVALLAVAEDERCLAGPGRAGSSPADPIWILRTLQEYRGGFDRLVVMVHGGNEGFPYPSPWLRELCRFLAEQGADLVLCQHSHCVGALERHAGGTILYGQGNFIFDYPGHGAKGAEGLGLVVRFPAAGPAEVALHPIEQVPGGNGIRLAPADRAEALLRTVEAQSEVLADPARLSEAWAAFAAPRLPGYLTKLFGFGRWLQRLNRGGWMFRHLGAGELLRIYNLLSCESNRSALREALDRALQAHERRGRP